MNGYQTQHSSIRIKSASQSLIHASSFAYVLLSTLANKCLNVLNRFCACVIGLHSIDGTNRVIPSSEVLNVRVSEGCHEINSQTLSPLSQPLQPLVISLTPGTDVSVIQSYNQDLSSSKFNTLFDKLIRCVPTH